MVLHLNDFASKTHMVRKVSCNFVGLTNFKGKLILYAAVSINLNYGKQLYVKQFLSFKILYVKEYWIIFVIYS